MPPTLLVVLIAPGSVEAEVGKVQTAIFSESGLASSQALPPLVPVAFLAGDAPPRDLLAEMNRSVDAGWRACITRSTWVEGYLFAGIDTGGAWAALRQCALARCGPETQRPFPAAEGFFLGCGDATAAQKRLIDPGLPPLAFTSAALALMRLEAPLPGPAWWRELHWETLEQRPLRGRKAK